MRKSRNAYYMFSTSIYYICESIVDNGTREGLDKFLKAASKEPETVLHYEFMQDYKVTTDINRYLSFYYTFSNEHLLRWC